MGSRSNHPRSFLSAGEVARVESSIVDMERRCSGQIKVVIARHCWLGLGRKARRLFDRFGLSATVERNCAMVLLVTSNRQVLVYGDRGIHRHVGSEFWPAVNQTMLERFKSDDFAGGFCDAIAMIGERMAEHFPPRESASNELSNRIEYAA